jgi:hypothetical protein
MHINTIDKLSDHFVEITVWSYGTYQPISVPDTQFWHNAKRYMELWDSVPEFHMVRKIYKGKIHTFITEKQ